MLATTAYLLSLRESTHLDRDPLNGSDASYEGEEIECMSEENLSGPAGIKKIGELIKDIRIAMMTTAASDGSFDSRPMATQ